MKETLYKTKFFMETRRHLGQEIPLYLSTVPMTVNMIKMWELLLAIPGNPIIFILKTGKYLNTTGRRLLLPVSADM